MEVYSVSPIFLLYCCTETHIPLIQTESLGSKVVRSEQQTAQKNYNFLSEINRCDFHLEAAIHFDRKTLQ